MVHRFTRPLVPRGVFLNEDLLFFFSEDVDRAAVTRASLRIVSSSGEEAHGSLRVEKNAVRFVPSPVLASDLSDGGYRPGTEYTVEIAGFPRPDGLRGIHGEPLSGTYRWAFSTVSLAEPREGPIFQDRLLGHFGRLQLFPAQAGNSEVPYSITTDDSIYLACDKPLDPSSLHDEDFALRSLGVGPNAGRTIDVHARLLENQPDAAPRARPDSIRSSKSAESWSRDRRAALIELTPRQRLEPQTRYILEILPKLRSGTSLPQRLCDFSGRAVWDPSLPLRQIQVQPGFRIAAQGALREEFLDTKLRSPVPLPDCDGTAFWGESGRVEVRYPAAAGTGADGFVALSGDELRGDIQATRLDLPARQRCALRAAPGLCVLRAQGRLTISGRLTRAAPSVDPGQFSEIELPLLDDPSRGPTRGNTRTLSEWLTRARERSDVSWTVLIAGGDLVIEGELVVSTPLLLCAGGVVRVPKEGSVRGSDQGVWILGEGGGLNISPAAGYVRRLAIDPPSGPNPLVETFHLRVMSGPIPQRGGVKRWLSNEKQGSVESRPGNPSRRWSVGYVPEVSSSTPDPADLTTFDSPVLFDRPGPLQLLIDLTIEPGGRWDPPFVDFVELAWEEAEGRR